MLWVGFHTAMREKGYDDENTLTGTSGISPIFAGRGPQPNANLRQTIAILRLGLHRCAALSFRNASGGFLPDRK